MMDQNSKDPSNRASLHSPVDSFPRSSLNAWEQCTEGWGQGKDAEKGPLKVNSGFLQCKAGTFPKYKVAACQRLRTEQIGLRNTFKGLRHSLQELQLLLKAQGQGRRFRQLRDERNTQGAYGHKKSDKGILCTTLCHQTQRSK